MKYVKKEDYEKGDFSNLVEVENTKELEKIIGPVKGYGIDLCPDDRADGILIVQE